MDRDAVLSLLEQVQDLLCAGKLTRYLPRAKPLPQCWKLLHCDRKRCPNYGKRGVRCWQVVGTLCAEHRKPTYSFRTKWTDCRDCPAYQSATVTKQARLEEALANIAHHLSGVAGTSVYESAVMRHRLPEIVQRHSLSVREAEALSYLCERISRKEMADRMGISYETVKMHVKSLYRKLGIRGSRDLQRSLRDTLVRPRPSSPGSSE